MKVLLLAAFALFLIGCGDDQATTNTVNTQSVVAEKVEPAKATVDEATKAAEIVVKEAAKEVQTAMVEPKKVVVEAAEETTKKAVAQIKEVAQETTKEVVVDTKEVVSEVSQKMEQAAASDESTSGAALYKACASCHGQKAEKAALGKSQIIQGWTSAKIAAALQGYKDGTYGGAMKNVMKGQASKLNDAQTQALAEYISTL